jgi:predicted transposase YdaD
MTGGIRDHDGTYRKLFEDHVILREFIAQFVSLNIIDELDLSRFETLDTAFLSESLLRRIPDKMWQVYTITAPHQEVIILLEFQSSVDRTMPIRIMGYIALLYQSLAQQREDPQQPLPLVIPIVLYNGKYTWHAPQFLRELIHPVPTPRDEHVIPRTSFELVDIHRLSSERLKRSDDILSLFFRFEQFKKLEQFPPLVDELIEKLEQDRYTGLRRSIAVWLYELLKSRGYRLGDEHINSILEVKMMIADRLDEIMEKELGEARERGLAEGREKGMQEGKQEGRQEGLTLAQQDFLVRQRQLVLKLLELKFGPHEKREARLADLSLEKLEALALTLMTVEHESQLDY